MNRLDSKKVFVLISVILIFSIACGVSFDLGGDKADAKSEVEQTLRVVYAQYTSEALAGAEGAQAAEGEENGGVSLADIQHATIPGNPGSPEVTKDEIDTSNTAGQKLALGDSFRLGNLERPFTEDVMDYYQENDLLEMKISKDDDFYYFVLEIVGPNKDTGILSAAYGVEFDTDLDGRGDVLLLAKGNSSAEWTIEGVSVYADSNEDVGGSSPVVPDTNDGNGYDQVLFSINDLNDPDAAWQKADGNEVLLAIKRSMVGGNRFFWKVWADSGLADPAKFDYNDSFSEEQAGSPVKTGNFYPVGQLNLMDSTCWIAYNLEATGKEVGGCYQLQPTPIPEPTKPSCPGCGTCAGLSQKCCNQCVNCSWGGGGCYKPPA